MTREYQQTIGIVHNHGTQCVPKTEQALNMSVELELTTSPHQNNGSSYESVSTNTPGDDNETRELVSHVVVADEEAPADLGSDKAVGSADATKYESFLGRWIRKLGFNVEDNDYSDVNVPKLSYWQIFKIFLWFGCRAFGGELDDDSVSSVRVLRSRSSCL